MKRVMLRVVTEHVARVSDDALECSPDCVYHSAVPTGDICRLPPTRVRIKNNQRTISCLESEVKS